MQVRNSRNNDLEQKLHAIYNNESIEFVENYSGKYGNYPAEIFSGGLNYDLDDLAKLCDLLNFSDKEIVKIDMGCRHSTMQIIIKTEKALAELKQAINQKCEEEAINKYGVFPYKFFKFTASSAEDFGDVFSHPDHPEFSKSIKEYLDEEKNNQEQLNCNYTLNDIADTLGLPREKFKSFAEDAFEITIQATDKEAAQQIAARMRNKVNAILQGGYPDKLFSNYNRLIKVGGNYVNDLPLVRIAMLPAQALMRAVLQYRQQQEYTATSDLNNDVSMNRP